MKVRQKILFRVIIFSSLAWLLPLFSIGKKGKFNDIEEKIACIPQEERIILSYFFRTLIQTFCAGHVLYGSKPMCLTGFHNSWKDYLDTANASSLSFWTRSCPGFEKYGLLMEAGL